MGYGHGPTALSEVRTDAHVPFVGRTLNVLVEFAELVFTRTVNKDHVHVEFRHEGFFLVEGASHAPEFRVQAEDFGKSLVAIERRQLK